jgi:hypothetical protein
MSTASRLTPLTRSLIDKADQFPFKSGWSMRRVQPAASLGRGQWRPDAVPRLQDCGAPRLPHAPNAPLGRRVKPGCQPHLSVSHALCRLQGLLAPALAGRAFACPYPQTRSNQPSRSGPLVIPQPGFFTVDFRGRSGLVATATPIAPGSALRRSVVRRLAEFFGCDHRTGSILRPSRIAHVCVDLRG